uniref:Putative secreted protein n=1 Tax=Anopheles marajoara TaxID=58244 RepID=A0A2M4C9Y3_9DIPT
MLLVLLCLVFSRTTYLRLRYCSKTHRTWESMHRPQYQQQQQQPKRTINRNDPQELMHRQVALAAAAAAADRACLVLAQSKQPATRLQRYR